MRIPIRVWLFRCVVGLSLLTGAAALSGCVAMAVGAGAAGAVAYSMGELKANVSGDIGSVVQATDRTIEQLRFFRLESKTDELSGLFTMRNSHDERIKISVTQAGQGVALVRIRVGVFGNELLSRSILDKIKENL